MRIVANSGQHSETTQQGLNAKNAAHRTGPMHFVIK